MIRRTALPVHLDGRTDGLAWDLGGASEVPIPRLLMPNNNFAGGVFPGDKQFLVKLEQETKPLPDSSAE